MGTRTRVGMGFLAMALIAACSRAPNPHLEEDVRAEAALPTATPERERARPLPGAPMSAPSAVSILVHKGPTCSCCAAWVTHLRKAGFVVTVRDTDQLEPIKQRVGIPPAKGSCHTAEVDGYFIEGHVPAEDIRRLLSERPAAKGLVLPRMPVGSPGMEVPGTPAEPYTVELVGNDGTTRPFARH